MNKKYKIMKIRYYNRKLFNLFNFEYLCNIIDGISKYSNRFIYDCKIIIIGIN
jgi:hypothetical protein